MQKINYLQNASVSALIANGEVFQKSALTGLRKVRADEVGTEFPTFVKDGEGIRRESLNQVTTDQVMARNPGVLSMDEHNEPVYNEWLIPMATAIKSYGAAVVEGLTDREFTYHKKQATVRAIPLTTDIMTLLGIQGDTLLIEVSWSSEPMVAKIGDYLTSGGYSISAHDMKDYELA